MYLLFMDRLKKDIHIAIAILTTNSLGNTLYLLTFLHAYVLIAVITSLRTSISKYLFALSSQRAEACVINATKHYHYTHKRGHRYSLLQLTPASCKKYESYRIKNL